jgi:hypothetical protein
MAMPAAVHRALRSLARRNVEGHFVEDGPAALELVKPYLTGDVIVATGNSLTLRQTGIFAYLASEQHPSRFINQFVPGLSFHENRTLKKAGLCADLYLSSANALTEDGKICFLDGGGNRLAAVLFGPEKVLVVVGRNKLVKDEQAAWERIRRVAAPQTAIALGRDLPCTVDARCHDCTSPDRICHYYLTISGQLERDRDRIEVIIVDEDLGL